MPIVSWPQRFPRKRRSIKNKAPLANVARPIQYKQMQYNTQASTEDDVDDVPETPRLFFEECWSTRKQAKHPNTTAVSGKRSSWGIHRAGTHPSTSRLEIPAKSILLAMGLGTDSLRTQQQREREKTCI